MVPLSIPQSARNMFQDGFERQAQQLQSRFKAFADVKTGLLGKSHTFKKIQKREMNDVVGRLQPTVGQEQTFEFRFLFPRKASLTTVLDEDDASDLGLAVAPTGEITMEHNSAAARKTDDIFISGILGTNYEGAEDSMQPVNLPAGQTVAVNYRRDGLTANTGLTLAKLIKGKSRFGKLEVYGQNVDDQSAGDSVCMAISQDELDNLLYDVEQTGSADYNSVKALVEGRVNYFMGVNFLRTERLPFTSVGGGKIVRTCPMWVKSGVRLGFWNDVTTTLSILTNPQNAIQIYSKLRCNAARKDEDRVVAILCEQDA